jgi:general secretion pathway protein B
MSYVLDALKKSENQRQQNQSPCLLSAYTAEPSFRNGKRLNWSYLVSGLTIMFLIAAALTTYRLRILPAPPGPLQVTQQTPAESGGGARVVINPELQVIETEIVHYLHPEPAQVNLSVEKKKVMMAEVRLPAAPAASVTPAAPPARIPALQDLPVEIRAALPELNISGHTFSANRAKRMIIINSKILREGGSIDNATTLKEITWEGIIIDYNGLLFKVDNE